MLYPLTFHPSFKERVWGGRHLERLYGKTLPPGRPIGESWEICDRPDESSVIANGPLSGKDLHWLMQHHQGELLGPAKSLDGRFPLLVKILDAREKLSLQVHPPADIAARLGGEPKTEMWYITDADPGAELYVGLKRGVTRDQFQQKLQTGHVAECFHRVAVRPGDAMFLPSGRVHAIGAGLVIFEIQQNSDTTYRVFDWNRVGLDGKPREMHVPQSIASINFEDFEPAIAGGDAARNAAIRSRQLVRDPLFNVDVLTARSREDLRLQPGRLRIIGVAEGRLSTATAAGKLDLLKGQFCVVPASTGCEFRVEPASTFLLVEAGE